VVGASDLHPVHPGNVLAKYADDMYILIGTLRRGTIEEELRSVEKWAKINNMRLNKAKSCELLVHRPRSSSAMPALIPGVQRVQTLKILGVTIGGSLQATSHLDATVSACSRSHYPILYPITDTRAVFVVSLVGSILMNIHDQ